MKAAWTETHQHVIDAVSENQLMAYTRELTKEVRSSGSPEELRAFLYAKEVLEGFGLQTSLSFHDAYISLPVNARLKIDNEAFSCITHSMSAATGRAGVSGELVYIAELTEELHLPGKLVLTDGIATPGAVELLENAGAAGAIFINGPIIHEMIVSRVWGNPTPETKKQLPKIPVVSVADPEGTRLKEKLAQNKTGVAVWMETVVDTGWRKIPTLTAEIKGEVEPDKFVLFSGHIDSWHYGAMDNGGANATMLEVARVISEQNLILRRSLRFAFWSGHSHGRYTGSAHYCDQHWEDLYDNCLLHVYIDSVGGKGANILGESNCMVETKEYGGAFVTELTGEEFIGKRFGRGGDQSFWGTGTPALFMGLSEQPLSDDLASQTLVKLFGGIKSGGFGWWWHTTEDTLDKIDPQNLRRDCQVYAAVLYDACTRNVLPFNHAAGAKELKEALQSYAKLAGNKLDFTKALKRVETIEALSAEFYDRLLTETWTDEEARKINDQSLAISHHLISLNYVSGDIHDQDLAMNQPPLPLLKDVAILAELEEGSDELYEWLTYLKRRLNKVEYVLKQAEQAVNRWRSMKEEKECLH
ncbi:M28 family peptidase [Planococcus ruber]|uniref:M28 family peptidase n=1 Tax=Planococcus ruber TaxID=2027871 RepID=UPI001FEEEAD0|nr:M28 family peptidase [Planococcus ruber]MCJ1909957.1 M28 family peptidase [Planococcus ruber]